MKIAVIGKGYVGLVIDTCLAEMGNNVICMDIDAAKVKKLQNGEILGSEPKYFKSSPTEGFINK